MKKTISFILCMTLAVSLLAGFALADEGLGNFSRVNTYSNGMYNDVSSQSWFNANVKDAYELGLMKGKASNSFAPYENVKLSETVALAARIHSIYYTGAANFEEGNPWCEVYYDYAVENGIIASSQYRDYEAYASRDQFVRILVKALPDSAMAVMNSVPGGAVGDVEYSSASHVYTFYRAGILTGKDDAGNFYPADKILRSEVAAVVSRMAVPALRVEFSLTVGAGTGTGSIASNIRLAYEAVGKANDALLLAAQAAAIPDTAAAALLLYQAQNYAVKAIEFAQAVCDATKDSAEYAKVYEFASTAVLASTEAAKCMQLMPANFWTLTKGYLDTASLALTRALENAI